MSAELAPNPSSPSLQRHRRLHTWAAALLMAPAMVVTQSMWSEGPHETLEWLGYAAIILCVLGRAWCTIYIGGRKRSEIVALGPYSVVRNPLYLFSFIGVTGIGLQFGEVTWALLMMAAFALYYRQVVRREESVLSAAFPVAYPAYCARTPRWLPDLRLWRNADSIAVNPALLTRALIDGAMFFVALPIIELLDYLHESGLVPTLLSLP